MNLPSFSSRLFLIITPKDAPIKSSPINFCQPADGDESEMSCPLQMSLTLLTPLLTLVLSSADILTSLKRTQPLIPSI